MEEINEMNKERPKEQKKGKKKKTEKEGEVIRGTVSETSHMYCIQASGTSWCVLACWPLPYISVLRFPCSWAKQAGVKCLWGHQSVHLFVQTQDLRGYLSYYINELGNLMFQSLKLISLMGMSWLKGQNWYIWQQRSRSAGGLRSLVTKAMDGHVLQYDLGPLCAVRFFSRFSRNCQLSARTAQAAQCKGAITQLCNIHTLWKKQ